MRTCNQITVGNLLVEENLTVDGYIDNTQLQNALDGYETTTVEDLSFPVDYNAAHPALVPPGTIFQRQSDIDAYLSAAGAISFKYLMDVYDALPTIIQHNITFNVAAGVQLPRPADMAGGISYNMTSKRVISTFYPSTASITIQGSTAYTTTVSSAVITAHQTNNGNPYVDVSGTPYSGKNLKGLFAIFNGQTSVIHSNANSRLYVTDALNPAITNLVSDVTVGQPSTVFRCSLDNVTPGPSGTYMFQLDVGDKNNNFNIYDITIDPFGVEYFIGVSFDTANANLQRVLIDNYTCTQAPFNIPVGPESTYFQDFGAGYANLYDCSYRELSKLGGAILFATASSVSNCFFGGSTYGIEVSSTNGFLAFYNSVVDNCGAAGSGYGVGMISCGGYFQSLDQGSGKYGELRNSVSGLPALTMSGGAAFIRFDYENLYFSGNAGPCVRVQDGATLIFSDGVSHGWFNGSGNTDVGIDIAGASTISRIDSGTTITGSVGDVRMQGTIVSYSSILSSGPYTDDSNNVITKVS